MAEQASASRQKRSKSSSTLKAVSVKKQAPQKDARGTGKPTPKRDPMSEYFGKRKPANQCRAISGPKPGRAANVSPSYLGNQRRGAAPGESSPDALPQEPGVKSVKLRRIPSPYPREIEAVDAKRLSRIEAAWSEAFALYLYDSSRCRLVDRESIKRLALKAIHALVYGGEVPDLSDFPEALDELKRCLATATEQHLLPKKFLFPAMNLEPWAQYIVNKKSLKPSRRRKRHVSKAA